jgi:hypothetical protein
MLYVSNVCRVSNCGHHLETTHKLHQCNSAVEPLLIPSACHVLRADSGAPQTWQFVMFPFLPGISIQPKSTIWSSGSAYEQATCEELSCHSFMMLSAQ